MPLVHSSTCGVCGAPRTTLDDAFVVTCEYCGSVMDVNVGEWFDPRKARLDSTQRVMGDSRMAARWRELTQQVYGGSTEHGPSFRLALDEYYYLYTYLFAELVPKRDQATVAARRAYARRTATAHWIRETDREIKAHWERMLEASRALMVDLGASADQFVAIAKTALAASGAAYTALKARPELAADFPAPAEYYARIVVRATVASIASMIKTPGAADRVMSEVLGDHRNAGRACSNCGAPLEASEAQAQRCAYCGAVIERSNPAEMLRAARS